MKRKEGKAIPVNGLEGGVSGIGEKNWANRKTLKQAPTLEKCPEMGRENRQMGRKGHENFWGGEGVVLHFRGKKK